MKICLDPGHGGAQPGAVYWGPPTLIEKDVVLSIARHTHDYLYVLDPGCKVIMTRSEDVTVGLQERCTFANRELADIFVSIHANADPDTDQPGMPEAHGEEIWYFKTSRKGLKLAKALWRWVDEIFPYEPFRGLRPTDILYVLKYTNMPAVLIEVGFIDKSSSVETFSNESTLRKIGSLIANGIREYYK